MRYKYSLVACARWETDAIEEWIVYHRELGFNHLYLYCNDDDPEELKSKVMSVDSINEFVTFYHWREVGQQRDMYTHYLEAHRSETEWLMFLDIDEFLCIKIDNNIDTIVGLMPVDCDAIYFNWLMFGPHGFVTRPPGSILPLYTRRARMPHPVVKSLVKSRSIDLPTLQNNKFMNPFWHFWQSDIFKDMRPYNVLGHDMRPFYNNTNEFIYHAKIYLQDLTVSQSILDIGCVYHFVIKSQSDFARRISRSTEGEFANQKAWLNLASKHGLLQFNTEFNEVEDFYLHDYWNKNLVDKLSR